VPKPATKEEKRHLERVAQIPCLICNNPYVEIHHVTTLRGYGKKASHFDTIPLCAIHHRLGDRGVAIHSGIKTWEEKHGAQIELLEKTRKLLKEQDSLRV
jgi:hypothetical protein